VFLLGAAVTATLSLDTTAVLLTPIVLAFIRRLDVPARPYVVACAFVANAGSLSLPISNLTNLVLVAAFRIPFATFVGRMLPIQVLVLGVTYASLRHQFRSELVAFDATRVATEPSEVVPSQPYFRATLGVLAIALVAYLVAPAAGIQPYAVAFVASGVLAALGVRAGRVDRATVGNISWKVVPFVLGLFVVVQGLEGLGLAEETARILAAVPGGEAGRILATTASNAIASNVVNNLPASLVARSVLERLHGRDALVYATLVGTNVGPNLVPFGSLASVLVLTTARERGVRVSGWAFARSGLVATPIACILAALAIAMLPR
jgi:arsenical pump membrane protein